MYHRREIENHKAKVLMNPTHPIGQERAKGGKGAKGKKGSTTYCGPAVGERRYSERNDWYHKEYRVPDSDPARPPDHCPPRELAR